MTKSAMSDLVLASNYAWQDQVRVLEKKMIRSDHQVTWLR